MSFCSVPLFPSFPVVGWDTHPPLLPPMLPPFPMVQVPLQSRGGEGRYDVSIGRIVWREPKGATMAPPRRWRWWPRMMRTWNPTIADDSTTLDEHEETRLPEEEPCHARETNEANVRPTSTSTCDTTTRPHERNEAKQEEEEGEDGTKECRICQDVGECKDMDAPCSCSGSMKYVHRSCVQRWCDEKGNTQCEICHQPFRGYVLSPEAAAVHRARRRGMDGNQRRMWNGEWDGTMDERELLETLSRTHRFGEHEPEEENVAAWCRSFGLAMIMMALLRNALVALTYAGEGGEENHAGSSATHHDNTPSYGPNQYPNTDPVDILLRLFVFVFLPAFLLIKGLSMIHNHQNMQQEGEDMEEMQEFTNDSRTQVPAQIP